VKDRIATAVCNKPKLALACNESVDVVEIKWWKAFRWWWTQCWVWSRGFCWQRSSKIFRWNDPRRKSKTTWVGACCSVYSS